MSKLSLLFLFFLVPFFGLAQGIVAVSLTKLVESNDGIKTSTLAKVKMDEMVFEELSKQVLAEYYPNIHSVLVYKDSRLVYELYKPGQDFVWGRDIGIVDHNVESLHDVRSISKSVISACIGIAITRGEIKSVDQRIFDFFEEYDAHNTAEKRDLCIEHLLTMTSGLEWNEEIPYSNPENSEIQMTRSEDPIEFILSRPMVSSPGKEWNYNGGTTQLLAAIIEKVSGMKADKYAETYLFGPLGIVHYEWIKFPGTDDPAAASGLRLRSRDLLKFGILYQSGGIWNKQEVIPESWISESFETKVTRRGGTNGYGYQFWTWSDTVDERDLNIVAAIGNGDQRIYFDEKDNLLVVVTAGNYNMWDIENDSFGIFKKVIESLKD